MVVAIQALVVFVTMMGSVSQRTHEIGVFRALGFRRAHITRLILLEAVIASVVAGVLGYLAGMGVTYVVLPFVASSAQVAWAPLLGIIAVGLAVVDRRARGALSRHCAQAPWTRPTRCGRCERRPAPPIANEDGACT